MNNNSNKETILKDKYLLNIVEPNINNNTQYKCILFSPLNKNDCVNSIDIFDNFIVYGTIMGDVILCRIDEEKYSTIENNKTDVNSSINKDIKNNDDKDIVLNINKENKNKKNIKISNETLKGNTEYIKIFLKGEDHKSTDNNSLINLNNKESNISKGKISFKKNNIPKIYKLISGCIENICCISLVNDILNFSIGDKEIIHCEKITSFFGNDLSMSYNFKRISIYDSEKNHNDFCENCSCLMSKNNFLIVYSYYSDFNWPLRFNQIKYDNRNLKTLEIISGFIEMSNYNVPFDFDGDKFLYIEYYDESIRCINIYNTLSKKKYLSYLIDKKFGHISHMKLLPNDCIFLCRNLFICEIYKYNSNITDDESNNNFILINMWVHNKNKEIISSNIYVLGNKISNEYKNNKIKSENLNKNEIHENSNLNKENKKGNKKNNILHNLINDDNNFSIDSCVSKNRILDFYKSNNEILNIENKENELKEESELNKKDIKNEDTYYIITLDIDGNFNLYYNKNENNIEIKITLFNLYKIKNISNNSKNLSFFSVGFPYYITMNEYYYIITTDNGIFVISKSKE
jgi:hypothetical protein